MIKRKRDPLKSAFKWLALAGAGFAAARRRRRKSSPLPSAQTPSSAYPSSANPSATPPKGAGGDSESGVLQVEKLWVPGMGGSLHLLRRNSDPNLIAADLPVLFVHGLGGSCEQWRAMLEALPAPFQGIALDLPGHGSSDVSVDDDAPLTMNDLSSAIGAVADGMGWRRFVLVGHSLGAAVAINYAGRQSRRVAGLLLVDPNGDQSRIPEAERKSVLEETRADAHQTLEWHYRELTRGSHPAVGERILGDLAATSAEVLHQTLAAGFDYSPLADLEKYEKASQGPIRCVLSPDNDLPFSLHRLKPEMQVAILRGAGHWLMLDDQDAVLELLGTFLDAAEPQVH